jgi:hypothetical protein
MIFIANKYYFVGETHFDSETRTLCLFQGEYVHNWQKREGSIFGEKNLVKVFCFGCHFYENDTTFEKEGACMDL